MLLLTLQKQGWLFSKDYSVADIGRYFLDNNSGLCASICYDFKLVEENVLEFREELKFRICALGPSALFRRN